MKDFTKRKDLLNYTVIFLIICFIGYLPFWMSGRSLVWKTDGVGQYYPAFLYIGQYIREYIGGMLKGSFSPKLFDLSIGMGEDVIGALNYYGMGDPLNLLAVFATKTNGAYVFTGMYFLRLYLAGLCFKKYCSYFKLDALLSTAGSLCYVFSGYAITGGAKYIQFLSPMIYLPLILLGIEKIFHDKKWLCLSLTAAYAAVCNFYFLYMVSLFLIPYCIVRCISIYGIKNPGEICKAIAGCIGACLLGIMLACPILLPSINALFDSLRKSADLRGILLNPDNYLPSLDRFKTYITGWQRPHTENYWTAIPFIECIGLAGTVFLIKDKRGRQCILALLFGTILWCIPITSIVFSGFNKVYDRWAFLLYFTYAVVFAFSFGRILKNKNLGKLCVLVLVSINISANLLLLYGQDAGGEYWSRRFIPFSEAGNYTASPVSASRSIQADNGAYRIANDTLAVNGRPENTAMLNGYHSLNFWFSLVNGSTQKMVNQIASPDKTDWRSFGLNSITLYESMAGVKYFLKKENEMEKTGYTCVEELLWHGKQWKVYQNENALPLAYTYRKCMTEETFLPLNELEKIDASARYLILESGTQSPVDKIQPELIYEVDAWKGKAGQDICIRCNGKGDEIYLFMDADDIPRDFILNNDKKTVFKGKSDNTVLYNLGNGSAGGTIDLTMDASGLSGEEVDRILQKTRVYAMNSVAFDKIMAERNELKDSDITIGKNRIEIKNASVLEDRWMLLAVPFSSNWRCYVDGDETSVHKGNTMYMAIRLGTGTHEILFVYRNPSFYAGIILFLTACIVITIKISPSINEQYRLRRLLPWIRSKNV